MPFFISFVHSPPPRDGHTTKKKKKRKEKKGKKRKKKSEEIVGDLREFYDKGENSNYFKRKKEKLSATDKLKIRRGVLGGTPKICEKFAQMT